LFSLSFAEEYLCVIISEDCDLLAVLEEEVLGHGMWVRR
jgi:hypothetical protein